MSVVRADQTRDERSREEPPRAEGVVGRRVHPSLRVVETRHTPAGMGLRARAKSMARAPKVRGPSARPSLRLAGREVRFTAHSRRERVSDLVDPWRDRRDRRWSDLRRRSGHARHRPGGVRLAQEGRRWAVPRAARRACGRARLRRRRDRAGRRCGAGHPSGRGSPHRGGRRVRGPGCARRRRRAQAARHHGHRDHRVVGQDVDEGHPRPGARRPRPDDRPARLVQQRAGPPVHGAARRHRHPLPHPGDERPRHRVTSRSWPASRHRGSASC